MKRLLSTFLLSLFCFSTIRPVVPFFEYAFNYEYISEVLCINKINVPLKCNGKCYLKDQLTSVNKQSESKEKQIPVIEIDKLPKMSITALYFFQRPLNDLLKHNILYFENLILNNSSKPPTPPPKFYLILV